jgi:hypothetical protein
MILTAAYDGRNKLILTSLLAFSQRRFENKAKVEITSTIDGTIICCNQNVNIAPKSKK